jgi:hypothetical protein
MASWRRAAVVASNQNLIDINMTTGAIHAIDVARGHFAMAAEAYARFRLGLPNPPLDGDALPSLLTAINHVKLAILRTRRLSSCHAGSGHVFYTAAERMGLPIALEWYDHQAAAAAHAGTALQSLRSAWSHGGAAWSVVDFMRVNSLPLRHAWGPAAEQLLRRTADDLDMARAALEQMRPAVVAEFSFAWMLLSR